MTGSLADYDRLCEALEAYEGGVTCCPSQTEAYTRLRAAAVRCGADPGEPVVAFAKRRRDTYRATITGAVAYLQEKIDALPTYSQG